MAGMFDITQWDLDSFEIGQTYGVEVIVTEHEGESCLLGPDGEPLRYERPQPIGFDLTPLVRRGR